MRMRVGVGCVHSCCMLCCVSCPRIKALDAAAAFCSGFCALEAHVAMCVSKTVILSKATQFALKKTREICLWVCPRASVNGMQKRKFFPLTATRLPTVQPLPNRYTGFIYSETVQRILTVQELTRRTIRRLINCWNRFAISMRILRNATKIV
jgi:hypothetical protein